MPGTPSVREPAVPVDDNPAGLVHSSCPPEDERDDSWIQAQIRLNAEAERPVAPSSLPTPPSTSSPQNTTPAETPIPSPNIKMDIEIESKPDGMMSPVSIGGASKPESETGEVKTPTQAQPLALNNYAAGSSSSMEYEFSNIRVSSISHWPKPHCHVVANNSSFCHPRRPPSCVRVASSPEYKNPTKTNTMWRLISSKSTGGNLPSADSSRLKVLSPLPTYSF